MIWLNLVSINCQLYTLFLLITVDGGFSDWSEFSKCTKSCGGGVQSRNRKCTNPVPSHGGSACDGLFTESQNCNIAPCPGKC